MMKRKLIHHLEARFVREVVALEDEDVDLLPLDNFFLAWLLLV
jgi:hypothetical protein